MSLTSFYTPNAFHIHYFQTFDVFKYISRGFYEKHKYLFTLLLTLKIDMQKEFVSYDEFQTLIKGLTSNIFIYFNTFI